MATKKKVSENHSERKHAVLSASGSKRWINCPASVELIKQVPPLPTSPAAEEGTAAHELSEKVLLNSPNANYYVGQKINNIEVTQEMADYVQDYCDYVIWRRNELGGELSVEERFDLSWLYKGMFGTNDALIRQDFGKLVVIDFKYGEGIPVEVYENTQLIYYAIGAARGEDYEEVELVIVQPRCEHPDGPIRSWTFPATDLQKWEKEFVKAAKETEKPNAKFKAGDWCRWCAAAATCPHVYKEAVKNAMIEFDDPVPVKKVEQLTDEQIARLLKHKTEIEALLKKAKEYALRRWQDNRPIEGTKLVGGRGSRIWNDDTFVPGELEEIMKPVGHSPYEPLKVLSVAKIETLMQGAKGAAGKRAIEHLWKKIEGNPTIAHESDRRQPIALNAKDEFDVIIDAEAYDDFDF